MKILKLNDEVSVMPDEISEVIVYGQDGYITVRLKSGVKHTLVAGYKEGIYAANARIIKEINEALQ